MVTSNQILLIYFTIMDDLFCEYYFNCTKNHYIGFDDNYTMIIWFNAEID